MRKLASHQEKMSDSGKIDLLTRAVFGDIDDETMKQTPGLLARFEGMDSKLRTIVYGGSFAAAVVVLHFLGVPTQTIWGLASKAAAATLVH